MALAAGLDNDTRGWIMCIVSGIACVVGGAIIYVDIIVRQIPGKRNFRIQDSNVFLACSLSLSFGVMLFSSLNSMLPESRGYLEDAGWSNQHASTVMMVCFIGGFVGIQAISRLLHQFIPSHVVDCDHSHDDGATLDGHEGEDGRARARSRVSRARRRESRTRSARTTSSKASTAAGVATENGHYGHAHHTHTHPQESTPLLDSGRPRLTVATKRHASARGDEMLQRSRSPHLPSRNRAKTSGAGYANRRPSMLQVQQRVMSFVKDTKCNCDELGSCYGFTDPCGQECFKHLSSRSSVGPRNQTSLRTTTGPFYPQSGSVFHGAHDHETADHEHPVSPKYRTSLGSSRDPLEPPCEEDEDGYCGAYEDRMDDSCCSPDEVDEDLEAQHHHHVPTNAFLSIGLQTSIAIALHKFPEGFITYATNHANPDLGFSIFMALFVHNISEGFAMALPLYMALNSRWRAIAWTTLLGGLSQPLGAGLAVLLFKLAQKTHLTPNAVVYACLFAVTAGIMVSVALQLFVESLSLNHNRNLCIFFGFIGMAMLGLSNAFFSH